MATTGQSAAIRARLVSGAGKLGLFCTKVAAEMKTGIHLRGRNLKDKGDENITVMLQNH